VAGGVAVQVHPARPVAHGLGLKVPSIENSRQEAQVYGLILQLQTWPKVMTQSSMGQSPWTLARAANGWGQ
jgi:hypothetical protein